MIAWTTVAKREEADRLAAHWGPGALRAPTRTYWGWNEIPMDADAITGVPLAFTLALPMGYQSMEQLFDAADDFGPRILSEVYDAIKNENQQAAEAYSEAIALEPKNARYYYFRATAFSNMEAFEAAIDDGTRAIELDADVPDYFFLRG